MTETTQVAIIGAGVAGLTLANLLLRQGVACIVLERQTRTHVEQRQRAGVIDHRAARMLEGSGLADVLKGARTDQGTTEFRVEGDRRFLDLSDLTGGGCAPMLPQQQLVQRLISAFLEAGGDLRFEVSDVALSGLTTDRPMVTHRTPTGNRKEIACDYVAGCDGFHGVSRRSIPEEARTEYSYSYVDDGIGWLMVQAETPPPRHPLFVVSRHGFAAQFGRGPNESRFYLQCAPGDDLDQWPEYRIWWQLRLRLDNAHLPDGPIHDKAMVDMRSYVIDPMSHGRLHLAGDAAHIIFPLGGKGMNLALSDADTLARALSSALDGDEGPIESYSATCLQHVWNYQEYSWWLTEMLHHAGDGSTVGPFRRQLARARLDRLFTSTTAATAFAELQLGLSWPEPGEEGDPRWLR